MKDHPDRHDESLPARRTSAPPAAPPEYPADDYAELPHQPPPPKRFSLRVTWRALRRHWWQALLCWLMVSGGLVALAYYKVKPTYEAVSQVQVENTSFIVYTAQNASAPIDPAQYMETQVKNLTSPPVIKSAFKVDPKITSVPMLAGSVDPESDIRRALLVGVVPKTNLIQVSMSSQDPDEGRVVVNAVVKAYLDLAKDQYDGSNQKNIARLTEVRDKQQKKVEEARTDVQALQKTIGSADVERLKNRNFASLDRYRQLSEQLTNVEIMRIAAKAKLDQLRNEKPQTVRPQDDEAISQATAEEFYRDSLVAALQVEREKAQTTFKDAKRRARSPSDPAVQHAEEKFKALDGKINDLWTKLAPGLKRKITASPTDDSLDHTIAEAESQLAALKTQEETLTAKLETLRVEDKASEGNVLQLEFRRRDLEGADEVFHQIQKNLSQLEFDASSPVARIDLLFPAERALRPNGDRRLQLMASAPVITGMLMLGLLTLMELRGGRVADPEELSSRMNLQVIGVVPPLPQIRSLVSASGDGSPPTPDPRAQRQLDEFVQSLDHLRVALCARRDPWGRDRHCVLITSACGSEGKTTLAAQLAERCVNAGLMTLLIDADLRNPTLSRMLDAPDNPGLINVLRGEVTAEDVVMVIGDAGGFHLLPAGTPRMDPSRLLASDRLGKLLTQARESFDMIIVDAPPVLPVPDALTIGRWTDGAVLAVRYDTSRFLLVERAYRRLGHVGVPVIGAVVNGVRSSESTYGGYAYGSYGYGYGSYGDTGTNGHGGGTNGVSSPAAPTSAVDD
jgi:capsular exopolysaccharide synthesis family protein